MKKKTGILQICLLLLLFAVAVVYVWVGVYYQTHFFERTTINGINVSDLTVEEAEALIAEQAEDYRLTVRTKEGAQETIEGDAIGYQFVSGGEVEQLLKQQNYFAWLPSYLGEAQTLTVKAAVTYEKGLLSEAAGRLMCMQPERVSAPVDAHLEQQDGVYVIIPETEGNQPDESKLVKVLAEAVDTGRTLVDLAEEDCYRKPKVLAESGSLRAEAAVRNRYSSITVTYDMGGGITETLDAGTIGEWFSLDENLQPVFDRTAVAAWVNQLADRYDTIGTWPPFRTSNGETVYVEARTYGWQMDREAETEALYQQLLTGTSTQRTPVYHETAWSRGENDIGSTYVEIDYTNQRMWYYKDGVLLAETPIVTGNVGAGMASPEGIFCLVGKEENATLKGEGYSTPVDYWMPFFGGVGIHDADSWRTEYGGSVYQWGGSHGCINTPTAQAAIIFQNIEVGTPIICYSSGINYGYEMLYTSGSAAGSGNEDGTGDETAEIDENPSDIVIIDDGSGSQDGAANDVTADGVPFIGEDLQDVIIDEEWADESVYNIE